MTVIKATCPICGDVDLDKPRSVEVIDARCYNCSSYTFTCPSCGERVTKPADEDVVLVLAGAGMPVRRVTKSPELDDPVRRYAVSLAGEDEEVLVRELYRVLESEKDPIWGHPAIKAAARIVGIRYRRRFW